MKKVFGTDDLSPVIIIDLGRSEWRYADENGSEVVVWKVEASENTSERWIVVGFGTNSIMYSYDIVYDQDHVDRIIKEKY